MSPNFLRQDGYTFKIFSNEEEHKRIHVIKAGNEANEFRKQFDEHIGKRIND